VVTAPYNEKRYGLGFEDKPAEPEAVGWEMLPIEKGGNV
jgi:hypothetical protein